MNLDASQKKAIQLKDGACLILAGPGSGKTTVITHRIQTLIQKHHVDPGTILVITFTRAAAMEMKERFLKLMGEQTSRVSFGTFHSVYFNILKHAYGYTSNNIVREEQRHQFVKEYIHRLRLEYENEADFISNLLAEISFVKNSEINLEHYYSSACGEDVFRSIYKGYQEFLYQNRLIDFDDMLVYCKELLDQRSDILNAWQRKYQYILIDEFQDINQIQFDIIRMLALPQNNLFVVGDDDQSIYQFRGAKPEIMLNFEKLYPQLQKVVLDTNYRSGRAIVDAASCLIRHNRIRFSKDIHASAGDGIEPIYLKFKKQREQNDYVIQEISRLHNKQGLPYCNMAVLFRTNSQPRLMMQQMMDMNIPYYAKDTVPILYDHWIAQDINAYLKVAAGDRSRNLFLKIMNRPKRFLSRESLPYDPVAFDVWEDYYNDRSWMLQRLVKFEQDLQIIGKMRPYSAINYIRKAVAYEDYIKEAAQERRIPEDDLMDILEEIHEESRGFATFEEWFAHIDKTREQWKERKNKDSHREDGVCLCTLHSAKGLEYEAVFIVDVDEKIMPYKKAVLDADIEEERRLFYVGMTRAKQLLYLCTTGQITNKTMQPSRFLKECRYSS